MKSLVSGRGLFPDGSMDGHIESKKGRRICQIAIQEVKTTTLVDPKLN